MVLRGGELPRKRNGWGNAFRLTRRLGRQSEQRHARPQRRISIFLPRGEHRLAQRKFCRHARFQPAHELQHQILGGVVVDVPKTHDDLGRANVIPSAHEAKSPALEHFAKAGLARAHHHEGVIRKQQALDVTSVQMVARQGQKAAIHRVDRIRQRMGGKIDEAGVPVALEPVQHMGLRGLFSEQRLFADQRRDLHRLAARTRKRRKVPTPILREIGIADDDAAHLALASPGPRLRR